jgi:hypothetical protein
MSKRHVHAKSLKNIYWGKGVGTVAWEADRGSYGPHATAHEPRGSGWLRQRIASGQHSMGGAQTKTAVCKRKNTILEDESRGAGTHAKRIGLSRECGGKAPQEQQ